MRVVFTREEAEALLVIAEVGASNIYQRRRTLATPEQVKAYQRAAQNIRDVLRFSDE